MAQPINALVLFSGGLDSMLAAKVLLEQGLAVKGICFVSPFYNADRALAAAKEIGLELKVCDIGPEMLALVKNPPSGYGKHINPCIDCHSLMIKKAGEIAEKENFDFIATGEVLGQRPFSQNKEALEKITRLSKVEVVRPLSAKLLSETEAEKKGFIKRGRLRDISGRTRDRQFELAKKYKLSNYASPAGGCLLTDPEFSERMLKLLDYWPVCATNDAELLKSGRIFWVLDSDGKKIMIVVGRHLKDNQNLEKIIKAGDYKLELSDIKGPTTLIRNLEHADHAGNVQAHIPEKLKMGELKLGEEKTVQEIIDLAALLTGYYSAKARGKDVAVMVNLNNHKS